MKHNTSTESRSLSLVNWPERLWKSVAWIVIICFSVNCLTPAVAAAKTLSRQAQLSAPPTKTDFDKASDALIALENTLDRMNRRLNGQFEFAWQATLAQKSHALPPVAATRADLQPMQTKLTSNVKTFEAQQPAIQTYFAKAKTQLATAHATTAIQARAQAQADKIRQLSAQLNTLLAAINSAKTNADYKTAVAAATAFMHAHSSKPKRAKFDPKHLAFGPSTTHARKPLTDPAAIRKAIGLTVKLGSQPSTKAATNSQPADLAPTEDVQITSAIIAKAKALDNNPLKIYQYVRNNVEYLPTYGSIEGSDYTLQTMRGNDMDQASLLIALLRAANIPSRYVYGTIRVPIAQIENWVGNVTDPTAALNLLSSGGVPTLGITQGGVLKYGQIEHVWVEAQIGYAPSRGAVTTAGNTWVPMDPSFKQYTYTDGMDLKTAVPFDGQTFADKVENTSTINTNEGWVRGVDQNYINTQLADYQAKVKDYVNNKNADANIGDVIGSKTIKPETPPLMAASLPYAVTAVASRMDALPADLRWKFHYTVGGETLLAQSLPRLAGHTLAVHFVPASEQDVQTLRSYFPAKMTDPSQMPDRLPAGVVALTTQVSVDGDAIASGPTYRLGGDVRVSGSIYRPGHGWANYVGSPLSAGDYQVIALATVGVSSAQLHVLQAQVQETQSALATDPAQAVSAHDLTAQLLQAVATGYFLQIYAKAHLLARAAGDVQYHLPSFGTVSIASSVRYFFGVPASYAPKGVVMDMTRLATTVTSRDGDAEKQRHFTEVNGAISSSHENSIAQEILSTEKQHAAGVSAVTSLALAAKQGQKIFRIDPNNVAATLPKLDTPPEVKSEIANAINVGKIVTAQEAKLQHAGISTYGYIIEDPDTGAAAYMILTGQNGGLVNFVNGSEGVLKYLWALKHFGDELSSLFKHLEGIFSGIGAAISAWQVFADLQQNCGNAGAAAVGIAWGALSFFLTGALYAAITALVIVPLFAIVLIFTISYFLSLLQEMIVSIADDICTAVRP